MATRKRNEWLDADESDEEEQNYESEDEGRAQILRSSKRQKVDHASGSEEAEDEPSGDEEDYDEEELGGYESEDAEIKRLEQLRSTLPTDLKLKTGKLSAKPKKDKSGVIYLSRVPPFMKPAVVRSLLTPYGPVGRIFLTPETAVQRQQRLKSGGTRRKLFLDGWVEFIHKKDAKFVAENLNAQSMGGKKRSRWHDEVWNIKYLSGVKWAYLVEEIQNQNAERAVRLRREIAKDKVENQRFLDNLEKGKMISGIETKRKQKGKLVEGEAEAQEESAGKPAKRERKSKFEQRETKTKFEKRAEPEERLQTVLSSIF
ncbi:Pre-rRNA-processing protein ESF2 [Periconia macrospinosa]|uniref:18S rRNA factor 2 n=1 Tax=Periconia macrospinosa TaxID=97972 RepID=A0A2V1DV25_9PLEO|nr:Pre-rRNA-processing protein ESF2 [Periconia macrospinosa]